LKRLRNSVIKWLFFSSLCLLFGFLLGKFQQDILTDQLSKLDHELQKVQEDNNSLKLALSSFQANVATEQQTIKSLLDSNKILQNELTVANNKLFFYERVLSPELESTGVKVYSFEITMNSETKQWDYQLVLMQSQKERRLLSGTFNITLSVFEGDELKQMSLPESEKTPNNAVNSFKFKYFQTIQGSFSLPESITVDEVLLQLNVAGNRWFKAQNHEQRFDWRVLTSKDASNLSEFDIIDNNSN